MPSRGGRCWDRRDRRVGSGWVPVWQPSVRRPRWVPSRRGHGPECSHRRAARGAAPAGRRGTSAARRRRRRADRAARRQVRRDPRPRAHQPGEYASILEEAETLDRADFRERVKDVVVEMAATGQTGMGFPEEYGGGGDIGASLAAFETLAFGDLSVLVKVGVQFGLFGGAILQLGTERHHAAYLPDLITGELMGCFAMTETGHGSNVQALGTVATYDAETREFVITTTEPTTPTRTTSATPRRTPSWRWSSPSSRWRASGTACTPSWCRSATTAQPRRGVRIEDDGPKMGLNGVDNGRLWFDGVRVPREALLNRFADVTADGVYASAIDNPNRRFFTMLGTLVQGRVCVGGAGINASQGRAGDRDPLRPAAPAVRGDHARTRRSCSSTTASTSAGCSRCSRAPTRCTSRRRSWPASARGLLRRARQRRAGPPRARVAGRRHQGARHLARHPHHPGVPRGLRRRRLPRREPVRRAQGRHRRLHHLRGRQHACCCSWSPRGCSPTTPASSRTSTSSAWSASSPTSPSRPCSSGPTRTSSSSGSATCSPAATQWDQEAGLLDPDYQLAMLRFREEHMLGGVARRLKRGIDQGMNPGEVFSLVQDHVIHAARAHVERLVLEAFVDKIRDDARTATTRSRSTCSATCTRCAAIEADRAWFMEHGRLTVGALEGDQPRDQRAVPQGPAAGRATWSTRSACPRRCCAART